MIFVAILLGTAVSNFIVDLLQYSTQVKYLINKSNSMICNQN